MNNDWKKSTMGEVLDVLRNGINCKQNKNGKGYKISRIESIASASFNAEKVGYATIDEEKKEKFRLNKGDILFSHINSPIHVGKTALFDLEEEIYHGVNLLLMRPKEHIYSKYLEYFLQSLFQSGYWLKVCKQSVNQASVNQRDINGVEIRYPLSIVEQKHIVAILDEVFGAIDKAKSNIERNIENAEELFQSKLNEIFSQKSEGWEEIKFDDAVNDTQIGLVRNKKQQDDNNEYRYFKMDNIKNQNGIEETSYTRVNANKEEVEKYELIEGDFLFNTRNSHELVGKSCIYSPNHKETTLFNNNILRARFKEDLDPYFIGYSFCSKPVKEQLESFKSGTTSVVGIYYKALKNLKIRYPSIDHQNEIIQFLDALRADTNTIFGSYQNKLKSAEELKKSILQKAFSGELTANETVAV